MQNQARGMVAEAENQFKDARTQHGKKTVNQLLNMAFQQAAGATGMIENAEVRAMVNSALDAGKDAAQDFAQNSGNGRKSMQQLAQAARNMAMDQARANGLPTNQA